MDLTHEARPLPGNDSSPGERPEAPRLMVRTLGGFAIQRGGDGEASPVGLPGQAIKFVIASGGRVHVEELMDALWPTAGVAEARKGVRNVLSRLTQMGLDVICRDGEALRLADGVWVDAFAFRALADKAITQHERGDQVQAARRALAHHGGEFLPDDRYHDWSELPRQQIRRRRVALLDLLAEHARLHGSAAEAIQLLELALEADPRDEIRYLELAELLLALGRRGRAAEVVERSRAALRDQGLLPGSAWARLQRELQQTRRATEALGAPLHETA